MIETWKDVKGYEGLYQVSNLGNIKSLHYYGGNKQVLLKTHKRKDGYLMVGLAKDGVHKTKTVHRIVAEAFIPNPDNLEMVNHKDECKSNNNAQNLEWCTRSYNQIYSMNLHEERRKRFANNFLKNGVSTSPFTRKGVPHTKTKPIIQRLKTGEFLAEYTSAADAAKHTGIPLSGITSACERNARTDRKQKRKVKAGSNGYVFEYKQEV